jgi:hypothetical protein
VGGGGVEVEVWILTRYPVLDSSFELDQQLSAATLKEEVYEIESCYL